MSEEKIPIGLCQCGCGGRTNLANLTNRRFGHIKGQPVRFIFHHQHGGALGSTTERFWKKVDKTDSCWIWTASTSKGHGRFVLQWKPTMVLVQAHRFAWEEINGKIPDGLVLDHLCRNRACVRPDHLEAVTNRENILRGMAPSILISKSGLCTRGHVKSGDNLSIRTYKSGKTLNVCRACDTMNRRRRLGRDESIPAGQLPKQSACKRGHPFDEKNTHYQLTTTGTSQRRCRKCCAIQVAEKRRLKKVEAA